MKEESIPHLIHDLACKKLGELSIGTRSISETSITLEIEDIKEKLIRISGENYNLDILAWCDWVLNSNFELSAQDKINLQFVKVAARLDKIDKNSE